MNTFIKFIAIGFLSVIFILLFCLGLFDRISFYILLLLPFPLLVISSKHHALHIPKYIGVLFGLFMGASIVSLVFSVNIQNTFEQLLSYGAMFLIFIVVYNNKHFFSSYMKPFTYVTSGILIAYSMMTAIFLEKGWYFLVPQNSLNLVYPSQPGHNHLGDFLIIPVLILLYEILRKKINITYIIALFLVLTMIFFSFSRSAYASVLMATLLLLGYRIKTHRHLSMTKFVVISSIVFMCVLSGIIVTKDIAIRTRQTNNIYEDLYRRFGLRTKTLFSNRFSYLEQGVSSVKKYPLFGAGLGNFSLLSRKFRQTPSDYSFSSHNIFIDMFSEGGMIGGTIFVLFAIISLVKSRKSEYFFVIAAMLVNFMFDYSFKINAMLLMFFTLNAVSVEEHSSFVLSKKLIYTTSFLLVLAACSIIMSNVFMAIHKYDQAWVFYPLTKTVYEPLFQQGFAYGKFKSGLEKGRNYLNLYGRIFNGETRVLMFVGDKYLNLYGDKQRALSYYNRAYEWDNSLDVAFAKKVYKLYKEVYGNVDAQRFALSYISKIANIKTDTYYSNQLKKDSYIMCTDLFGICPYSIIYNP